MPVSQHDGKPRPLYSLHLENVVIYLTKSTRRGSHQMAVSFVEFLFASVLNQISEFFPLFLKYGKYGTVN